MKVLKDLISASSKHKEVNSICYMLTLRQIGRDDGSVDVKEALIELSYKFGVMPKTVLNRLHICANKGYGNFNKAGDRFYYYSQERMLAAMDEPLTSKTSVKIDDFSGSVVEVRARFHAAVIASRNNTTTVTRKTIKNWSGRANQTQRNYERLVDIEVTPNYARFIEYNGDPYELSRIRYLGHAAFIKQDPLDKKHYITKQLANTYSVPLAFHKVSRKVKQPGIIVGSGNVKKTKVYYESINAGIKAWEATEGKNDVYVWNQNAHTWEWFLGHQGFLE